MAQIKLMTEPISFPNAFGTKCIQPLSINFHISVDSLLNWRAQKDESGHWTEVIRIVAGNIMKSVICQNESAIKSQCNVCFILNGHSARDIELPTSLAGIVAPYFYHCPWRSTWQCQRF